MARDSDEYTCSAFNYIQPTGTERTLRVSNSRQANFFFQLVYQKKFFCQFFKIPINYNQILKN